MSARFSRAEMKDEESREGSSKSSMILHVLCCTAYRNTYYRHDMMSGHKYCCAISSSFRSLSSPDSRSQ
eukprot:scaffold8400_cov135-Skeletonema_menzelii.AAC.1